MTENTVRSVAHATFVIERVYDASPSRVFNAWADPAAKTRWFGADEGWESLEYALNFRVGGREVNRGRMQGTAIDYEAYYRDIVQDERIVYTYDMHMDGAHISVSIGTVEFKPEGAGTRMVYTEQGAFLDGLDNAAEREEGTRVLFDALAAALDRQRA